MSMLERIRPRAFRDYQALPVLGPVLEDFLLWSLGRGTTLGSAKNQLKDCLRISKFLVGRGVVSWASIPFDALDGAYRYFHDDHLEISGTVRRVEEFLREKRGMPVRPRPTPTRSGETLDAFLAHLSEVMGLGASAISSHRIYISFFLEFIDLENDAKALASLTSSVVDEFIAIRAKTLNRQSLQHLVGYLRSFLRFEFSHGALPIPLHERIDTPRVYRLEKLPRSLPWTTVNALLDGIDRNEAHGKRNLAMLLLMATYGLRSIEVVSLTLDDIDWRGKAIHILQRKTGHRLSLPLTDAVADALIDYLKNARPASARREIFLRMRAPLTFRLKPASVSDVFQREARLSGLDIKEQGAHCLRHSFAVHLLRQGTPMNVIGDILGHQSVESTCVYLRMAVEDLREVALDVPSPPDGEHVFLPPAAVKFPRIRQCRRRGPRMPLRSFLKEEIEAYLRLHHSLGKGFKREEYILESLDLFIVEHCPAERTFDYALFARWCGTLSDYGSTERRNKMRVVRNFCLYRQRSFPDAFIPDILTFPNCSPKYLPFIIQPCDIGRLLLAIPVALCHDRHELRQATMRLAIIILFTTGLRRGELLRLSLKDFNHCDRTFLIQTAKFHKQRIIPLSDSTAQEVRSYLERCQQLGLSMDPMSPLIRHGSPGNERGYTDGGLRGNWRTACASAKLLTPKGVPPRIHDLRHSFAVNALLRWYEQGDEPQAKLPQLATYMGHVSILSTHYYLSFVEPIRSAASLRFEKAYGNLTQKSREGNAR